MDGAAAERKPHRAASTSRRRPRRRLPTPPRASLRRSIQSVEAEWEGAACDIPPRHRPLVPYKNDQCGRTAPSTPFASRDLSKWLPASWLAPVVDCLILPHSLVPRISLT